jgi:hypothetical protein
MANEHMRGWSFSAKGEIIPEGISDKTKINLCEFKQENVTIHNNSLPNQDFQKAFHEWYDKLETHSEITLREAWLKHCGEFFDWYTSLRG